MDCQQSMVELIELLAVVYRSDVLARDLSAASASASINSASAVADGKTGGSIINTSTATDIYHPESDGNSATAAFASTLQSRFQSLHEQFVTIAVNSIYDKYMSAVHSHVMHNYHHHRQNQTSHATIDDSTRSIYCSEQYRQLLLVIFLYQSHHTRISSRTIHDSNGFLNGSINFSGKSMDYATNLKNIDVWLKYVEHLMYYKHILAAALASSSSTSVGYDDVSTDAKCIDAVERGHAAVIRMNHDDKQLLLRYQSHALEWMLLIIQTHATNSLQDSAEAMATYNEVLMKMSTLLQRIERDYLW